MLKVFFKGTMTKYWTVGLVSHNTALSRKSNVYYKYLIIENCKGQQPANSFCLNSRITIIGKLVGIKFCCNTCIAYFSGQKDHYG